MTYAQAIRKVIQEEMRRDDKVFVMGQDVEKLGGVFGTTRDLYKEFGTGRIRPPFPSPLSWVRPLAPPAPGCVLLQS